MKIVETMGIYRYEITGNSEKSELAASWDLEWRYDFLTRSNRNGWVFLSELETQRKIVENRFNVKIKAVI